MNCKDKVAIVTGAAGSGMGRSIALTLAREAARVVVNYKTSQASAQAIVEHIERRMVCLEVLEGNPLVNSNMSPSINPDFGMRSSSKSTIFLPFHKGNNFFDNIFLFFLVIVNGLMVLFSMVLIPKFKGVTPEERRTLEFLMKLRKSRFLIKYKKDFNVDLILN